MEKKYLKHHSLTLKANEMMQHNEDSILHPHINLSLSINVKIQFFFLTIYKTLNFFNYSFLHLNFETLEKLS